MFNNFRDNGAFIYNTRIACSHEEVKTKSERFFLYLYIRPLLFFRSIAYGFWLRTRHRSYITTYKITSNNVSSCVCVYIYSGKDQFRQRGISDRVRPTCRLLLLDSSRRSCIIYCTYIKTFRLRRHRVIGHENGYMYVRACVCLFVRM